MNETPNNPPQNLQENQENKDMQVKSSFQSFNKPDNITSSKIPIVYIILGVIIAGALALLAAYFFGFGNISDIISPLSKDGSSGMEQGSDETVMNPLTGVLYKRSEAPWIEDRPLAAMVNNYIDARPQSGLIYADIIYEIVAEGGITRFIPFYLSETPEKIGPIRSARDYYLVLVKELGDAMIMHIGWSPQALEAIQTWPVRSLGRGGAEFWRDTSLNVAVEHTAYVDGTYLRELGDELGWEGNREFTVWQFKDDSPVIEMLPQEDPCTITAAYCTPLSIDFWYEGDYTGIFKYEPETNSYLRFTGYDEGGEPIPHVDRETNEQIRVKNVIVQFADETPIEGDNKNRLSYQLVGSGSGLVFLDGTVEEVTWSKEDRDGRTMFYDLDGQEMQFNRGKIWISIVPTRNTAQVEY